MSVLRSVLRTSGGGGSAAAKYLLDRYPGAIAYGTSKLRATYKGAAFRILRDSDDEELDIRFRCDGRIDEDTIKDFLGASDGFLKTWYDQGTTENHAAQATKGSMPQIAIAGSAIRRVAANVVDFDGASQFLTMTASPFSTNTARDVYVLGTARTAATGEAILHVGNDLTVQAGRAYLISSEIAIRVAGAIVFDEDFISDDELSQLSILYPGGGSSSDITARLNGTELGVSSDTDTTLDTGLLYRIIGKAGHQEAYFDGQLSQLVIYPSDTSSFAPAIEREQVKVLSKQPGADVSGVCISFDDTVHAPAWKLFDDTYGQARGWKATFCLYTRNIDDYPTEINSLYANGHELGNHSTEVDMIDLATYFASNDAQDYFDTYIDPVNADIAAEVTGFPGTKSFSWPFGEDIITASDYFIESTGLTMVRDVESLGKQRFYYDGTEQVMNAYWIDNGSGRSLDQIKFLIDLAKKTNTIVMLVLHRIDATAGDFNIAPLTLDAILEYINSLGMRYYRMDELLPSVFE